jgi:hypothetical protein
MAPLLGWIRRREALGFSLALLGDLHCETGRQPSIQVISGTQEKSCRVVFSDSRRVRGSRRGAVLNSFSNACDRNPRRGADAKHCACNGRRGEAFHLAVSAIASPDRRVAALTSSSNQQVDACRGVRESLPSEPDFEGGTEGREPRGG